MEEESEDKPSKLPEFLVLFVVLILLIFRYKTYYSYILLLIEKILYTKGSRGWSTNSSPICPPPKRKSRERKNLIKLYAATALKGGSLGSEEGVQFNMDLLLSFAKRAFVLPVLPCSHNHFHFTFAWLLCGEEVRVGEWFEGFRIQLTKKDKLGHS